MLEVFDVKDRHQNITNGYMLLKIEIERKINHELNVEIVFDLLYRLMKKNLFSFEKIFANQLIMCRFERIYPGSL